MHLQLVTYKILIVAPPYKSIPNDGFGAIEKVMIERGRILTHLGLEVSFVLPENSILEFSKKNYYIRKPKKEDKSDGHVGNIEFLKSYINLHIEDDFDVIINETSRYDLFNYFNFQRLFKNEKTINVLHGNGMRGISKKKPFFLRTPVLGALNRHTFESLKGNRWKAAYFPNGIVIPEQQKIISWSEKYLIFIGRITPSKGPDLAIQIAIKSNSKLFMFGPIHDPTYFDSVLKPKMDGDKIIYMGEQPWAVVEEYLRKASALIFSSTFDDPQPTVILEALSYGVPILALKPGYYSGFYDICNDSNSVISDSIDGLVSNFEDVFSISRKKVYEDTMRDWSWESVSKRYYVPLFNQIVDFQI